MLDSAFIVIFALIGLKGFWGGDSREVRSLFVIAIVLLLALVPANEIGLDLQESGLTAEFSWPIAYSLAAAIIYPISYVSVSLLARELNYFGKKIPLLKRCLGSAFALLKGLVMLILLSNLLLRIPLESSVLRQSHLLKVFDLRTHSAEPQP